MNKVRRAALQKIHDELSELKSRLEALKDEEQEYIDNMPENLHGSERYEAAEGAVYAMDSIEEAMA